MTRNFPLILKCFLQKRGAVLVKDYRSWDLAWPLGFSLVPFALFLVVFFCNLLNVLVVFTSPF